jgi:glycerophosphoryl diester phosphodiesterase
MRSTALYCFGLLTAAAAWIQAAEKPSPNRKPYFAQPIQISAHRGGAGLWPEETIFAYRQAAQRWPQAILEGDARQTSDGQVVLLHDAVVDRTTDGKGKAAEKTLAQLRQLDVGYKFTPDKGKTYPHRGKGLRIATLEEALAALPDRRFQIEIKGGPELAQAVVEVVLKANAVDRVLLASADSKSVAKVRELSPQSPLCYSIQGATQMLGRLRKGEWKQYEPTADVLTMPASMLKTLSITPEEVREIRAKGIFLQFFTINSANEMRRLLDAGADSLITDRPDLLAEILAR